MNITITPTAEPKGRRKHQELIDECRKHAERSGVFDTPTEDVLRGAAVCLESLSPVVEPELVVQSIDNLRTGYGPAGVWTYDGSMWMVVGCGASRSVLHISQMKDIGRSTAAGGVVLTYLGPIASIEIRYTPHTGGTDAK